MEGRQPFASADEGKPRQGRMTRHCRSIPAVFAFALLSLGGVAATAQAHGGTLLSGYGTPGEGNQAILGSALLGGGSGGGAGSGGSRGSGGGQGAAQPGGSQGAGVQAAGSTGASTGTGSGASRTTGRTGAGQKQTANGTGNHSLSRSGRGAAGTSGGSHTLFAGSASANSASVPVLGITGTDLLYILLGVGGLLLTGIFTRQLVHRPH
jgi:hypothetical protein